MKNKKLIIVFLILCIVIVTYSLKHNYMISYFTDTEDQLITEKLISLGYEEKIPSNYKNIFKYEKDIDGNTKFFSMSTEKYVGYENPRENIDYETNNIITGSQQIFILVNPQNNYNKLIWYSKGKQLILDNQGLCTFTGRYCSELNKEFLTSNKEWSGEYIIGFENEEFKLLLKDTFETLNIDYSGLNYFTEFTISDLDRENCEKYGIGDNC